MTLETRIDVTGRFLLDNAPIAPDRDASFREMIEAAMEFGLTLASWEDWLEFRKARNKTAHTYLEEVQRGLVDQASRFLPVARYVLETVKRRRPVMSHQGTIDLSKRDLSLVRSIVEQYLPGRTVFVFGSRATGRARRHSDLDLAVSGTPLTLREEAILDNAFEESDLPITVDIINLEQATGLFRERIASELLPLFSTAENAVSPSERPVAA